MMHTFVPVLLTALAGYGFTAVTPQHEHAKPAERTTYGIPQSLEAEHQELHAELAAAMKLGGKTGAAAEEVERALAPHFAKEEEYALPPLGLLKPLAEGKVAPEMHETAMLAARLKTELPQMLQEHQAIVKTLEALSSAARAENKAEALRFADKLKLHAQNEEEVLYPAAILVGEYLTLKMRH
jgi:hypothetical protein